MPKLIPDAPDVEMLKNRNIPITKRPNIVSAVPMTSGTPDIYLERYEDRGYGLTLTPICKPREEPAVAHWLEKAGIGKYGKESGFDLWNPGSAFSLSPVDHNAFHFYGFFMVTSNDQFHERLRNWLVEERTVYANIVQGLLARKVITEEEARRPLRIRVVGYDAREASEGPKMEFSSAPFPDVAPPGTEITWENRYSR